MYKYINSNTELLNHKVTLEYLLQKFWYIHPVCLPPIRLAVFHPSSLSTLNYVGSLPCIQSVYPELRWQSSTDLNSRIIRPGQDSDYSLCQIKWTSTRQDMKPRHWVPKPLHTTDEDGLGFTVPTTIMVETTHCV